MIKPMLQSQRALLLYACTVFLIGCAGKPDQDATSEPVSPDDIVVTGADFECLNNWDLIDNLAITNIADNLNKALLLANDPQPGMQYPLGTIVQLFPTEAMVKRAPGYDPENNDWEYLKLYVDAEGTIIRERGRSEISNFFGGCRDCHEDARAFDFICLDTHGCVQLPVGDTFIANERNRDPRCTAVP